MQRAVNPETGETWVLVDGEWVKDEQLDPITEAELRAQPQPTRQRGRLEGALGQLNQGLLLGYNDELQAGLGAVGDAISGRGGLGESYRRRQAEEEAAQYAYANYNPMTSSALRGVGAAAPVAGLLMAGQPAAAATAGRRGMLGSMAQGAGYGGAFGATDMLGNTPTSEKDTASGALMAAGKGGAIGAAIGAAVPPMVEMAAALRAPAQKLAKYVNEVVGGNPLPSGIAAPPAPNLSGMPAPGPVSRMRAGSIQGRVLDTITEAGLTPGAVREAVAGGRAVGAPTSIMDVVGLPAQRQVRGARTLMGPAGHMIDSRLGQRAAGQFDRASAAVEQGMGAKPIAPGAALDELATQQRTMAKPKYAEAEAFGRIEDPAVLQDLVERGSVYAPLHAQARSLKMRTSGDTVQPLYSDDGVLLRTPTTRDIDMIKKGANAEAFHSSRATSSKALDKEAVADLNRTIYSKDPDSLGLLARVDDVVPAYGEARAIYAGAHRMRDIVEQGQGVLKQSPEEIGAFVRTLENEAEKAMYRGSAVQAVQQQLMKAADRAQAANVLRDIFGWGSGSKREQLRALFPNPKAFAEFESWAKREIEIVVSRRFVTGGSQTADKLVEGADLSLSAADLVAGPTSLASRGIRYAGEALSNAAGKESRYMLADELTSDAGRQADEFLKGLEALYRQRLAAQGRRSSSNFSAGLGGSQLDQ